MDWTLMQEIQSNAPEMLPAEIRNYLGKFLFCGDDVFKAISVLSGGERSRLALAILALRGVNLIFLDEPTNHLDLPSQEILQAVLAEFVGTVLLVTHDRYLLEALATQIWKVDVASRTLQVFKGGYKEFATQQHASAQSVVKNTWQRKTVREMKKAKQRSNQQKLRELEAQIQEVEGELKALEQKLAEAGVDGKKVSELGESYLFLQEQLDDMIERWNKFYEQSNLS